MPNRLHFLVIVSDESLDNFSVTVKGDDRGAVRLFENKPDDESWLASDISASLLCNLQALEVSYYAGPDESRVRYGAIRLSELIQGRDMVEPEVPLCDMADVSQPDLFELPHQLKV